MLCVCQLNKHVGTKTNDGRTINDWKDRNHEELKSYQPFDMISATL